MPGISVHGHFVGIERQEGVGIKTRGWLHQNCHTKIGRKAYCQVFVDLDITDYKEKYRKLYSLAGKYQLRYFDSMYNWKYACIICPEGCKLTEIHPRYLKLIFENFNITDF